MQSIIEKINFEKTYFYSFVVFAFLLPLSRASNSFFPLFLILLFLLKGEYKSYINSFKDNALSQAIILFIAFATLSLSWSNNIINGLDFMRFYWQWFAIFAIAFNVKKEQISTIISAFILGIFISEMLSYGMFFDLWKFHGLGSESPSPFMHHIDYSVYLAFSSLILLNRILSNRYSKKEKLFMAIFFVSIATNLFINKGRTGQVGLFVSIILVVMLHYRLSFKTFIISLALVGVVFSSAYTFSSQFQKRVSVAQKDFDKMSNNNYLSSIGRRVAQYYVTDDIFKENPIIGVGVGDWRDASAKALEKDSHGFSKRVVELLPMTHFHSQYLNILVQSGLIGLALFFYLFYRYVTLKIEDDELKELSLVLVSVYMIGFLVEPLWMKQFTNVLFILFSGLFLGASLHSSEKKVI